MTDTARIFKSGRSQAVRLPLAYRFKDCEEVYIRKDPKTGDIILSRRPTSLEDFFQAREEARKAGEIPEDLAGRSEAPRKASERDPFSGWQE